MTRIHPRSQNNLKVRLNLARLNLKVRLNLASKIQKKYKKTKLAQQLNFKNSRYPHDNIKLLNITQI